METVKCKDCGEKIPAARLVALPFTRRCVRCVERSGDVRKTKGYTDFSDPHAPILILGEAAVEAGKAYDRMTWGTGAHSALVLSESLKTS